MLSVVLLSCAWHPGVSTVTAMQVLASFLKCIGHIIPLMDAVYANYYTREVMFILVREFQTPDEEMKKIVLKARYSHDLLPKHSEGDCVCVCVSR